MYEKFVCIENKKILFQSVKLDYLIINTKWCRKNPTLCVLLPSSLHAECIYFWQTELCARNLVFLTTLTQEAYKKWAFAMCVATCSLVEELKFAVLFLIWL